MATERLSMRSIREVPRQKWVLQKSHREVARSLGLSAGAVGGVMVRASKLGLDWATAEALPGRNRTFSLGRYTSESDNMDYVN
jgi:transposase